MTPNVKLRVRLEHPTTVDVDADGNLSLIMPSGAFRFDAEHTGMWIALRRHDGDVDEATETLARRWNADPAVVCEGLRLWVTELCTAGLASVD